MCGFVGCYSQHFSLDELQHHTVSAADAIDHRGPDDSGVWGGAPGIALAHRRLSILDLSPLGKQPYLSPEVGQVLVYNGEIYNFREVRDQLEQEGRTFQSSGDTEVLSVALEAWGVERTLQVVNGMFAFALWDPKTEKLTLARDRVGIKPLYYGWNRLGFFCASELRAVFAYPGFQAELSEEALTLFMQHGYIAAPYSIFNRFWKLPPGSWITLTLSELKGELGDFSPFLRGAKLSPRPYWEVEQEAGSEEGAKSIEYQAALEELESLLRDSVRLRTVADVPLGAFLSGGIDSSTVVSLLAQRDQGALTKTFSIGFQESEYDEAPYAKLVAEHLGTEHHELYVSSEEALSVVPELPEIYSEPFADSSQVPTTLVSRLARHHVTVSLSGDGGDELFQGYSRYVLAEDAWRYLKYLPRGIRSPLGGAIRLFSESFWQSLYRGVEAFLPQRTRGLHHVGSKAHNLASVIGSRSIGELYTVGNTYWRRPDFPVRFSEGKTVLTERGLEERFSSSQNYFSYLDLHTYLPDDILAKVDRASMSCSLEARVPLLDHRVVEFSRRLPLEFKLGGGGQKRILRDLLRKFVPAELFERPKAGFGVPLPEWLRSPLREWGEDLLSEELLPHDGFLNRDLILSYWQKHQDGIRDLHYPLWNVFMLQSWIVRWRENICLP